MPASGSDCQAGGRAAGSSPRASSKQGVYVFQAGADDPAALTVEINYSGSPNVVLVRR